MSVTIYHNPRCSKSRETLALLESKGITPEVVLYLTQPITLEQLDQLLTQLNFESAHQLVRHKDPVYKALNLSRDTAEQQLREQMIAQPKLIERPIVVHNNKAALGRPPEAVMDLF